MRVLLNLSVLIIVILSIASTPSLTIDEKPYAHADVGSFPGNITSRRYTNIYYNSDLFKIDSFIKAGNFLLTIQYSEIKAGGAGYARYQYFLVIYRARDSSKMYNFTLTNNPVNNKIVWEYAYVGENYVLIYSYNASKMYLLYNLDKDLPNYYEYNLMTGDNVEHLYIVKTGRDMIIGVTDRYLYVICSRFRNLIQRQFRFRAISLFYDDEQIYVISFSDTAVTSDQTGSYYGVLLETYSYQSPIINTMIDVAQDISDVFVGKYGDKIILLNRREGFVKLYSLTNRYIMLSKTSLNYTKIYASQIVDKYLALIVNKNGELFSAFIDLDDLNNILEYNIQQKSGDLLKIATCELSPPILYNGLDNKYVVLMVKPVNTKLAVISPRYGLINPVLIIQGEPMIVGYGTLIIYKDQQYSGTSGSKYYIKTIDGSSTYELSGVSSRVYSFSVDKTVYITYSTPSGTSGKGDILNLMTISAISHIVLVGIPVVFEYIDNNNIPHKYVIENPPYLITVTSGTISAKFMNKEYPIPAELYSYESINIPEFSLIYVDTRDYFGVLKINGMPADILITPYGSSRTIIISFKGGYSEYYLPAGDYRVTAILSNNLIYETEIILEKGSSYDLTLSPEIFTSTQTTNSDFINNLIPFAMIGLLILFTLLSLISIILSRKRS